MLKIKFFYLSFFFITFFFYILFFFFITQDNFYIWDTYLWFVGFQTNFSKPFILWSGHFTPLYDNLYFYLFKLVGLQKPSFWFLLTAFWHVLNAFLLFKVLSLFFPSQFSFQFPSQIPSQTKSHSFLPLMFVLLFLGFSVFHENLFYSTANDKHLMVATFIFSSFFFYLRYFNQYFNQYFNHQVSGSAFPLNLPFSILFMILAFSTSQESFLLPLYIFLHIALSHFLHFPLHKSLLASKPFKTFLVAILLLTITFLIIHWFILTTYSPELAFQHSNTLNIYGHPLNLKLISMTLIHAFLEFLIPFAVSLPLFLKIPLAIFFFGSIFGSMTFIFRTSSSDLRVKLIFLLLFSFLSSFLSLFPFLFGEIDTQNAKLPSRYLYLSAFWFILFLFIIAHRFYLQFKTTTLTLLTFFIIFHFVALVFANQIIYIPTSQAHKTLVRLNQKSHYINKNIPICYSLFGIHKKKYIDSQYSDLIYQYIQETKNFPSKYSSKYLLKIK